MHDPQSYLLRLIEERRRAFLSEHGPAWHSLEKILLSLGGERVVIPMTDPQLALILDPERRRVWGQTRGTIHGERSDCHRNVARVYQRMGTHGYQIATGYALSPDALWRQHSWLLDRRGQTIDTTVPRVKYVGIVLTRDEALEFSAQQLQPR